MGVSLAFLQNKTFMQLSGEGWKCDSSALKWLYRKSYPTLCLRLLIFTAPLSGGEEVGKGRSEELVQVFECWIWTTWCCASPVIVQWPFLISANVELQTKFVQKSFTYFLSEEFIQPVICSRIIPQQGWRKKKAGGASVVNNSSHPTSLGAKWPLCLAPTGAGEEGGMPPISPLAAGVNRGTQHTQAHSKQGQGAANTLWPKIWQLLLISC